MMVAKLYTTAGGFFFRKKEEDPENVDQEHQNFLQTAFV